jgi:superfamily II DNA/RNA helicase
MPIIHAGVFVKPYSFHHSLRHLCGYLGIPSTGNYRKWQDDSKTKAIIEPFVVEYGNCFGLTGPSCKRDKVVSIKELLDGYKDPTAAKFLSAPTLEAIPIDKYRPLHCHLHTMYALIQAFPDVFKDSVGKEQVSAEDIHRTAYLLKYVIKSHGTARKGSGKPRDELAIPPTFYPDENGTPEPTLSTQVEKVQPASTAPIGPVVDGESDSDMSGDDDDRIGVVENSMSAIATTDLGIPKLSPEELDALLVKLQQGSPDCLTPAGSIDANTCNKLIAMSTALENVENVDGDSAGASRSLWELNRLLNTAGAEAPSYIAACEMLELDPENPMVGNTRLQPWQVTGIAWMRAREILGIRGGILGDQCGLGKTVQILMLILKAARLAKPPYRPTLIVAPSGLVDTWIEEIHSRFSDSFILHLFYGVVGPGGTTDPIRKRYTVNPKKLDEIVSKMSPDDPNTSRTIILSAYGTWQTRTFRAPKPLNLGRDGRESQESQEEDLESDESGDVEVDTGTTTWPGTCSFERIVMDEAHYIKNPRTKNHRAIAILPTLNYWFVTATAMINKPLDLKGYLSLLYAPEFSRTAPDFREVSDSLEVYRSSPIDAHNDLHLLDPQLYARLFSMGHISPEASLIALPRILNKIQLRRMMGASMETLDGETVVIGAQIPPYVIRTIEVKMTPLQMAQYVKFHTSLVGKLRKPPAQEMSQEQIHEVGGRFDMKTYRRLRHLAFSLSLEHLAQSTSATREGNLARDIAGWRGKPGGGLIWYLSRVIRDSATPWIPQSREWICEYFVNTTPKFSPLAQIVKIRVIDAKRRLLIFLGYPMPQYKTEMFLTTLGLNVLTLRAGMTNQERTAVAAKFNNRDEKVDALVVTYATCSQGLNLHLACCDVIMLEPALGANTTLQVVGRVHRLGQDEPQNIWIISGDNTFDRFVEYNQAVKMLGQVIGMGHELFEHLNLGREGLSSEDINEALKSQADVFYMQMMGQKISRLSWDNIHDLGLTKTEMQRIRRFNKYLEIPHVTSGSKKVLEMQTPTKANDKEAPDTPTPTKAKGRKALTSQTSTKAKRSAQKLGAVGNSGAAGIEAQSPGATGAAKAVGSDAQSPGATSAAKAVGSDAQSPGATSAVEAAGSDTEGADAIGTMGRKRNADAAGMEDQATGRNLRPAASEAAGSDAEGPDAIGTMVRKRNSDAADMEDRTIERDLRPRKLVVVQDPRPKSVRDAINQSIQRKTSRKTKTSGK